MGQLRKRGGVWWIRLRFVIAASLISPGCLAPGDRRTSASTLPPCPGLVLGSDRADRIVLRNTTSKGFDNVTVSMAGEETLAGANAPIFGFKAFIERLDPNDEVDLTDSLVRPDGTRWSRLTMRMKYVNVEAAKVCESGFAQPNKRH